MITDKRYNPARYGCYLTNLSMAAVIMLSPFLFETFRETYGVSYTLLGLLVLINFCTQLLVDLLFSFFSKHFNIKLTVRMTPAITVFGLFVYAGLPALFPQHAYLWLVVGTVIFAASAGLSEVLMSPVIAAMPSDNPEREMSKLHSIYAWGVVGVVLVNALFLRLFGSQNWMFLAFGWTVLPLLAFVLFLKSELPPMETAAEEEGSGGRAPAEKARNRRALLAGIPLFFLCIFLGGAAENTMSQWISIYSENVLGISKFWGDVCGMAMFAAMLGLGRTLYAKFGKNISTVLIACFGGATVCYLVASLSGIPILGLAACAFTGFCVSMLWPGSLIATSERFPKGGVVVYALMAAGGDLGSSLAPQLMGILSDSVAESGFAAELALKYSMTAEQVGMKAGMLAAAIFPILGLVTALLVRRSLKKSKPVSAPSPLPPESGPEL